MASAATEKPEMSRYLQESTKTGDFNPRRTLSVSFFVIPERLASILSVVHGFGVLVGNSQNWEISKKMAVSRDGKTGNVTISSIKHKDGRFQPQESSGLLSMEPSEGRI